MFAGCTEQPQQAEREEGHGLSSDHRALDKEEDLAHAGQGQLP